MIGFKIMSWFLIIPIVSLITISNLSEASREHPSAIVVGTVYCDTCFTQDFSKASHFISGATVAVECKDGKSKPSFRKEVKTNQHGEFQVHLPTSVSKYVKKIQGCSVKLIKSSEPNCAVASTATSSSLHLKSRKQGAHIFSAGFFTFKPLTQPNLCNQKPSLENSKEVKSINGLLPDPTNNPTLPSPTQNPAIPLQAPLPPSSNLPQIPAIILPLPAIPQLPAIPPLPTIPPVPGLVPPVPELPTPPVPGLVPPVPELPTPPLPGLVPPVPQLPTPPVPGLVPPVPQLPTPPVPGLPPVPQLPTPPVPGLVPPVPQLPTPPVPGLPPVPQLPTPPVTGLVPPVPQLPTPPVPGLVPPVPQLPTPPVPSLVPPVPQLPTPPVPGLVPPVPQLPIPPVPGTPPASPSPKKTIP